MECYVMCESATDSKTQNLIKSQFMGSIKNQLRKSRSKMCEIDENEIEKALEYFHSTGTRPVVIVVGFTAMWLDKCLDRLRLHNIHPLLLTPTKEYLFLKKESTVSFDEREAMTTLCKYFAENGVRKVAYFGYDPNRYSHSVQYSIFQKCKAAFNFPNIHPYYDCYSDYGNIDKCAQVFFSRYNDYEAVICSNPNCAVKLVHDMKKLGISCDKLHIASIGSSMLSNSISPKITSYNFDSTLCGEKAVKLYKILVNNPEISFLSAHISGSLNINESTSFIPFKNTSFNPNPYVAFNVTHPTYITSGDNEIDEITRIENLLCESDAIDRDYIEKIIANEDTKDFAEKHFISESTLNYRIKNMYKILGVNSKKDMYNILTSWMK